MIKSVLVVCLGNICRSPMGEGMLKLALPNAQISSAGLTALVGQEADSMSVKIMAEQGIDISTHRARSVTEILSRSSDLILVMDTQQKNHLTQLYPFARGKTFRLCETLAQDIPDPYRANEATFRASFELIARGCADWEKRIRSI